MKLKILYYLRVSIVLSLMCLYYLFYLVISLLIAVIETLYNNLFCVAMYCCLFLQASAAGTLCDECKPGTFHLSADNPDGCMQCFCMGVTRQCASSTWTRDRVIQFSNPIVHFA